MAKVESALWLRCQHTIRKLLLNTGKDALFVSVHLPKRSAEATRPQ